MEADSISRQHKVIKMTDQRYAGRISATAALGGLLFGFDTAIISGAIPFIQPYFNLNAAMLGWAVGSGLIGCAAGCVLAGYVADKYGRKGALIMCAVVFAVSGIGVATSVDLSTFVLFRIVGGLGVGAAAMVSPMYIAEIAPVRQRGSLVAFYQLAIVTGILLAYFVNYACRDLGPGNWRWMFGTQAVPAVVFFVLLRFVPESPRWTATKGELAGAKIWQKKYRKVLVVGILLAVFQQITGINAILYYAPTIFQETKIGSADSLLFTIIIGAVNLLATFIAIGFVDRVGRRRFLLSGCIIMGVSLLAVAACFQTHFFRGYLVLLFTLVYVAAFGCTLGAVTWVYLSEIFPNRIRAQALAVSTFALWLADFIVSYSFPIITGYFSTAITLSIYAGCCVLAFVFIISKIPETKGRSLEEMETLFI